MKIHSSWVANPVLGEEMCDLGFLPFYIILYHITHLWLTNLGLVY